MSFPVRNHTLSRSKIVVGIPSDWLVSDTQAAQRYGKGDPVKTNLALVQRVCTFDGAKWPIADIQSKLTGKDYTELLGEVFGDDDEDAETSSEGTEGNG